MLLTFTTLGCPDLTLEQAQALAAKHHIATIEVRSLGDTLELPDYLAKTYGTPEKLAARLREAPVRIVALDTSLKLANAAPGDREKFLALVPWAEALDVKWLRAFDGGKSPATDQLAEMAATVKWWRDLRARNGWHCDLMVETHDALVTTPAINRFLELAPGTAILWDTHHTWKKGGEDPVATWRAIKAHVVHVHVKDSISVPSARHPFTYVLPGTGEFPIAPIRAVLKAEFSGPVSLEWEKVWHPYLPPLEDALTAVEKNRWW